LDKRLSFDNHVNDVCKTCYWHIRACRHVRDSLPDEVAKTVAHSVVSSLLDYCNALYAGMAEVNLLKLQRVQNALVRVTVCKRKCDHITPSGQRSVMKLGGSWSRLPFFSFCSSPFIFLISLPGAAPPFNPAL